MVPKAQDFEAWRSAILEAPRSDPARRESEKAIRSRTASPQGRPAPTMVLIIIVLLALSSSAGAAAEFRLLRYYPPNAVSMCLGASLTRIGDIDGDSIPESVVGAPSRCPQVEFSIPGSVQLISGRTGLRIGELNGPSGSAEFGSAVTSIDGPPGVRTSSLAVGAPGTSHGGLFGAGSVFAISATTGAVTYETTAGTPPGSVLGGQFGASLARVGDVTGDGVPDLIVGAPRATHEGTTSGSAYLVSGASGSLVDSIVGSAPWEGLGTTVLTLGDWNGDGDVDVAISSPSLQAPGGGLGRVLILDPAHSSSIDTLLAGPGDVAFGEIGRAHV